ncbi:hypothetical protein CSHISOI_01866 [Colletotrichum shisoi]|uniref:Uncharacterized protein n=1 Tax=Colletotrichum shisoi TaxID=2078593 RepID=A0A5Q4C2V2_9PEZI|nr:hypothetical protein CSHISOI_01866 [Colletotrichum shisoi]
MDGKVWWTVHDVEQPGLPRGKSTFGLCSSKDSVLEVLRHSGPQRKPAMLLKKGLDKELWVIPTSLDGTESVGQCTLPMYDCLSVYPKRMTEWKRKLSFQAWPAGLR